MNRWLIPLMVLIAAGLVISLVGLTTFAFRLRGAPEPGALEPDPALAGLSVPEFTLVDQNGKTQTQAILDGHVTILDFTFTHCPFACPMMNASMIELAGDLAETPARFLSISVDPEHDTPAALKAHADQLGVDQSRWTFLTGDKETIKRIAGGALMFALQPDDTRTIDLPDGTKMQNIMHPTKFLLIGPNRRVLGLYDHNREEDMRNLKYRVRAALVELAKKK